MTAFQRWSFALAVVLVDLFLFVLPLTGLAAAYILIVRPPWFRVWMDDMYRSP